MDSQPHCQQDLEKYGLTPRKYHGQVFTTDPQVIGQLIETIKSIYRPGTKIVEIGGGLGYITERLIKNFEGVEVWEIDDELFEVLENKFCHPDRSGGMNKKFVQKEGFSLIQGDIMNYKPNDEEYIFVGNIPFHISGQLYRKFMSDIEHKPYGMVFITDKNYAQTLMGQPPRCYRVSLQAQAYGDIEIVADVPPTSVYPEPKVMSCIMKITQNDLVLPKNFWDVVNYHWENFPTAEVESPKTVGLEGWLRLAEKEGDGFKKVT